MGVTIHFSGTLRAAGELHAVRTIAQRWASRWGCEVVDINEPMKELIRVRNGEVCIYESPVTGLMLDPHKDAESLLLEFDSDLYMQFFCKTQFAPSQVHVDIIDFFREVEPHFKDFEVKDEGGYWETGDRDHLEAQLALGLRLINMLRAHDGALIAPLIEDAVRGRDRLKDPDHSPN